MKNTGIKRESVVKIILLGIYWGLFYYCLWFYKNGILNFFDQKKILLGKNFSGRSVIFQKLFLLMVALILVMVIFFWLKKGCTLNWENDLFRTSIIVLPLLGVFGLFGIIASRQVFKRDDFSEIKDAMNYGCHGFFQQTMHSFGRYATVFLKSLYAVLPHYFYLHTMLLIILILSGYACFKLSYVYLTCFSNQLTKKQILLFSIISGFILTMVFYLISPNVWEYYFWGSGAFVYGIGTDFILLSFSGILIYLIQDTGSFFFISAFICLIPACGFCELSTVSICIFSFFLMLDTIVKKTKSKKRKNIISYCIFSWICSGFALLSPGNFNRTSNRIGMSDQSLWAFFWSNFGKSIMTSIKKIIDYTGIEINVFIICWFIFLIFGMFVPIRRDQLKRLSAVSLILIMTAVFSPIINTIIGYTPSRVMTVPLIWIFLAICPWFMVAGSLISQGNAGKFSFAGILFCSLTAFVLSMEFFANHINQVNSIQRQWDYRDQILTSKADPDYTVTCSIPVMGSNMTDISEDPEQEFNIVAAYYYDTKKIAAFDSCEDEMARKNIK